MTNSPESLKHEILRLTSEYSKLVHADFLPANHPLRPAWRNDQSIPYAGRVFDNEEVVTAVSSVLDFWLTLGKEGQSFESELQNYLGVKSSILTNSGSSANLLAISALTSHKIDIDRRLLPGDEVITVAAGFPPLLHRYYRLELFQYLLTFALYLAIFALIKLRVLIEMERLRLWFWRML